MADDGSNIARGPPFRMNLWIGECLPDLRRRMIDELRQSNRAWLNHGFLLQFKSAIQGLQPFSPVMLEWLQPLVHRKQASRLDMVVPLAASSLVANQLGGPQHLQMFRNRRPVQSKLIDQVVDCVRPIEQELRIRRRTGFDRTAKTSGVVVMQEIYVGNFRRVNTGRKEFRSRIRGQVAFVQMINPDQCRPLLAALDAISG